VGASRGPTSEFGKMLIMTLTARVRRPDRGIGWRVSSSIKKMVQPINYVIKIKKIYVVIIS
jgi:hypothetical protein